MPISNYYLAAERQNGYLREQRDEWERKAISNFEYCSEMTMRIEELESQRQIAFMAGNRWADKSREAEKRIAEMKALARGVKQFSEFQICHYGATEDYAKGYIDWRPITLPNMQDKLTLFSGLLSQICPTVKIRKVQMMRNYLI